MNFDAWMLLAGIGIFLFGIYLMEESLKTLSGKAFKSFIRRYTSSTLKSITSGAFATAILQSSSAVTLMVLAFVGAGIMTLKNAIGVVLGSNLGTTLTSWIVATVGFRFDIESFAHPFIGIGGLGLIFFGRATRASNVSKLMVGFGFLFLGLDFMKTSVEQFTELFDLSTSRHFSIFFFLLVGFVITAVMQSSSAAMAIILTALYGNVIDFYNATAMVIGTNMGTTATVLIGSIGGVVAKKQVAMGHVIFNFITGIVAFIFLRPLNYLLMDILGLQHDPLLALALFHTLFNAFGVLLFFPFIQYLAAMISGIIKDRKIHLSLFVHNATSEVPEAGITALKNETIHLIRLVMVHNVKLFNLEPGLIFSGENVPSAWSASGSPDKVYSAIKSIQSEIFMFSAKLQRKELTEEEAVTLNRMLQAVHHCVASAKTLKDIAHELDRMEQSDLIIINRKHQQFRKTVMHFYIIFDEVLEEQNNSVNLPRLIKSMQKLHEDEQHAMKELSQSIISDEIHEGYISSLLSASRGFSLSLRQLALSLRDLVLTAEESEIYENMEFSEADLKNLYRE